MEEKKAIVREWTAGQKAAPVPLAQLLASKTSPKPYQRVLMPSLSFLPQIFLLDNQIQHRQAGYRVFRLAFVEGLASSVPLTILIAGAWISYESIGNQDSLGAAAAGSASKIGYVQFPSKGLQLSAQAYQIPVKWPLIMQWIDTVAISRLIGREVAAFWIQVDKPQLPALSPEKHLGYALQWFLFAGLWIGYGGYLLFRRQKGVPH